MNGTQTVGELLDPLMSESKSTFGQRLVTTDDEVLLSFICFECPSFRSMCNF